MKHPRILEPTGEHPVDIRASAKGSALRDCSMMPWSNRALTPRIQSVLMIVPNSSTQITTGLPADVVGS
jgi:hypothetical protein